MSILQKLRKTKKAPVGEGASHVHPESGPAAKVVPAETKSPKAVPAKEIVQDAKVAERPSEKSANVPAYAHRTLLQPVISEKSARHASAHQYVFKVHPNANKVMVKKAIKEMYNVEPESIRIINVPGKQILRGTTRGRTKSYKKAIVRVGKDVELPIYEGV